MQLSLATAGMEGWEGEVTAEVSKHLGGGGTLALVAPGDLFVVRCVERSADGGAGSRRRFLLASFHGDTNGLATVPVVDALHKHMRLREVDEAAAAGKPTDAPPPPLLVLGIDANTHVAHEEGTRQGVVEFAAHLSSLGLASCWGAADPRVHTTYNARTFLQPQLNKAVRMADRATSPLTDRHPKDHVVFSRGYRAGAGAKSGSRAMAGFRAKLVSRDNSGDGTFLPDAPFPTLRFPSDHAAVCAELEPVRFER
jgi:hypothetical protein